MLLNLIFIILSLAGLTISSYLSYHHRKEKDKPLACPINHDCGVVTESKWSNVFGVRNETIGIVFYSLMVLTMLVVIALPPLAAFGYLFMALATGLALLFSAFLVLVQFFIIKDYCFWCLLSTVITVGMFGVVVGMK